MTLHTIFFLGAQAGSSGGSTTTVTQTATTETISGKGGFVQGGETFTTGSETPGTVGGETETGGKIILNEFNSNFGSQDLLVLPQHLLQHIRHLPVDPDLHTLAPHLRAVHQRQLKFQKLEQRRAPQEVLLFTRAVVIWTKFPRVVCYTSEALLLLVTHLHVTKAISKSLWMDPAWNVTYTVSVKLVKTTVRTVLVVLNANLDITVRVSIFSGRLNATAAKRVSLAAKNAWMGFIQNIPAVRNTRQHERSLIALLKVLVRSWANSIRHFSATKMCGTSAIQ